MGSIPRLYLCHRQSPDVTALLLANPAIFVVIFLVISLIRKAETKFTFEDVGEARRRLTYVVIKGDQGSKVGMKVRACVCVPLTFLFSLVLFCRSCLTPTSLPQILSEVGFWLKVALTHNWQTLSFILLQAWLSRKDKL